MYGSTPPPGENGPTFLDFPLFLGILQWHEPTKRVPFTAEPETPEILTKWKAPQVRNDTKSESVVEGPRSRKLVFANICILSPSIFQIYITMICSEMLLIHFSYYFGKRRRFLQPGAYTFPTSFFHASLDTVFNHFNGMRKRLLKKR